MAKELTDILLDAIKANDELVTMTGSRVFDTCNEVPSWQDKDNTQCPYIVIVEKPATNDTSTKDWLWESYIDHCAASIIICDETPDKVRALRRKVRKAVADYIEYLADQGESVPNLTSSGYEGVAWDEMKPCYNDAINYQCDMDVVEEPEES